ncbi:MAG: DUF1788 domain-containing protein [Chloroflexota bacterium]
MSIKLREGPISDRFHHLHNVISSPRFLKMEGLGNEIPFFICAYKPEESQEIQPMIGQLANRLAEKGVTALVIDLYDLSIELLEKRNILESVLTLETEISKSELKELLQGVLDPEKHLAPAIAEKMAQQMSQQPFHVLFLTGVGEIYPFIRSHNILNNLQSTAKEQPTLMFYPGDYIQTNESGASLDLFGRLHDDKYYRAFDIFEIE